MMWVDEIVIEVMGGRGGDGCVSFHREKYRPRMGPDGGKGGRGGDVFLLSDPALTSLSSLEAHKRYCAESGKPGGGNRRTGSSGKSLILRVPVGTRVLDESGKLFYDFTAESEKILIARGGRGGRGNASFVTSDHQTPYHTESGQAGEHRIFHLDYRIPADVALVSLPGAGKSSLMNALCHLQLKTANYPFTTRQPLRGYLRREWEEPLVLIELPALVAGSPPWKGPRNPFLKHLFRVSLILLILEARGETLTQIFQSAEEQSSALLEEIRCYDSSFLNKPTLRVLNKIDQQPQIGVALGELLQRNYIPVSCRTGEGLTRLMDEIFSRALRGSPESIPS